MAGLSAFFDVGDSLATHLDQAMPATWEARTRLVSAQTLAESEPVLSPGLSLFLYRVKVNEHLRNVRSYSNPDAQPKLSVELHYMLTSWAPDAEKEHLMLAWAMNMMHREPILDASNLSPGGGWREDEVIQLMPLDLSIEDTMRIWDALAPTYRLSVCYAARVIQIEDQQNEPPRMIARRFGLSQGLGGEG